MKLFPQILTTGLSLNDGSYMIRRFDVERDQPFLTEICKDVYGGRDYLPNTAHKLASDAQCRFLVLTNVDMNDQPLAVANIRCNILPNMAWLEAVRTCPSQRGRGLARQLTEALIGLARQEFDSHVFTCTIESNIAMKKVFAKVGMHPIHTMHQMKMSELQKLAGWSAIHDDGNDASDHEVVQPQPLMQALGLEKHISAKAKEQTWTRVQSIEELEQTLVKIKQNGGMVPGLYKLLSTELMQKSLEAGLIWKLQNQEDLATAVMAFTKDDQIQSLRSDLVCSIAATTTLALEAAVWFACSPDCLSQLDSTAFTLSIDGKIQVQGNALCEALPLVDDVCVLFGTPCPSTSMTV